MRKTEKKSVTPGTMLKGVYHKLYPLRQVLLDESQELRQLCQMLLDEGQTGELINELTKAIERIDSALALLPEE